MASPIAAPIGSHLTSDLTEEFGFCLLGTIAQLGRAAAVCAPLPLGEEEDAGVVVEAPGSDGAAPYGCGREEANPPPPASAPSPSAPSPSAPSSPCSPVPGVRSAACLEAALAAALAANAALELERGRLEAELGAASATTEQWSAVAAAERCADSFVVAALVNALVLSPMLTARFAEVARAQLGLALGKISFIERLRWINCSFPATPANAPLLKLVRWSSLADSEWYVEWTPQWSCDVCVEARTLLRYSMQIHVAKCRLRGKCHLSLSADLACVKGRFLEPPQVELDASCVVTLGQLPLPLVPLLSLVEERVREEFLAWICRTMVEPYSMTVDIAQLRHKQVLTEADLEVATEAALEASERAQENKLRHIC